MTLKTDFNCDFTKEYDKQINNVLPGYYLLHELAQYLLEDTLDHSSKILVAGVGTGNEILYYARNNPGWSLLGFDPSEPMIKIAEQKILENNYEDRVTLIKGLIHDVKENDFDAATSILVMHFIADNGEKLEYLKALSARLKHGAKLILVDLEGDKDSPEYEVLNSAWQKQQLATRDDNDQVNDEFERRKNELHCIPQHRIESLLSEAGFANVYKFYKAYLVGGYVAVKI